MAKKPNLTTKPQYKAGYEAARNDQPCKSPHRDGTALTDIWLAGYDAYVSGSKPPQEPRKKRTKVEMEEERINPVSSMPPSMVMRRKVEPYVRKPRPDCWLEKLFAAQAAIKTETDPELLELLHMEIADLNWIIEAQSCTKPSERWDEYKIEHDLNFDRKVA